MITPPQVTELFIVILLIWAGFEHGLPLVEYWWQVWRGKVGVRDWRSGK